MFGLLLLFADTGGAGSSAAGLRLLGDAQSISGFLGA